MKKVVISLLAIMALVACKGRDDVKPGYSKDVQEVVDVLKGEWEKVDEPKDERLSFAPFGETKKMTAKAFTSEVINFMYGRTKREFIYVGGKWETSDMYFTLQPSKMQLQLYNVVDDTHFSVVGYKSYTYEIVDQNTIQLIDNSLSLPISNTYRRN